MKNRFKKVITQIVLLYITVLLLTPLFHLHPDEDHHHDLHSGVIHSHSLPSDMPFSGHDETEIPAEEDLELLQLIPRNQNVLKFDIQYRLTLFSHLFNNETILLSTNSKALLNRQLKPNPLSPQWDNYILFAASISPPLSA